jgi:glycosyltransferase involved in cell wall biosynthesis
MAQTSNSPGTFDLTLQGRYRPGVRVQFYGMLQGCFSIAAVCTQLGRVLTERLQGAALHSYNGGSFFDPSLTEHAGVDRAAPVGFFYGFPHEVPEAFNDHPFRIGGFVCETDRIAQSWVEACNSLDLVVVPSTFCRRAFYDSGVTVPVMVVPHGLEPEYRPVGEKRRSEPLVFYNVFDEGSLLERKNAEELIRCFLEAFGPSGEECVLRLRTRLSPGLVVIRQRHDFGRAILLDLPDQRNTAAFARIYSEVHCTVHPSRGEGFGLVPFQSIACETPVIAPAATGMADFLNDDNAMCLRTAGRTAGVLGGNQAGTYFTIDEDHLVELLHHAHTNWEEEARRVQTAAPEFRDRYSWDAVLCELIEVIEEVLGAEDSDRVQRSLFDRFGP